MKKEIIFYSVFIGFFGTILISCVHDLPNVKDMPTVCFTSEVLPIFKGSCAMSGCHDSKTAESGLVLDNYSSIMQAITAGDAKNSEAYQVIVAKWFNAMPPDKPISQDARTLIRIWIDQGAKNTTCPGN